MHMNVTFFYSCVGLRLHDHTNNTDIGRQDCIGLNIAKLDVY